MPRTGSPEPTRRILAEWAGIGLFVLALVGFLGWTSLSTIFSPSPVAKTEIDSPDAKPVSSPTDNSFQLAEQLAGRWAEEGYTCNEAMTLDARGSVIDVYSADGSLIRTLAIKERRGNQLTTTDAIAEVRFRLKSNSLAYSEGTWSRWFKRCA